MINLIIKGHDWSKAYQLEAQFRYIFSEQASRGWKIDVKRMGELQEDLGGKVELLYNEIRELAPKRVVNLKECKKRINKNGESNQKFLSWWNGLGEDRILALNDYWGDFTRVKIERINPGSPPQRVNALQKIGWIPTDWNHKKDKRNKTIYINNKPIETSPMITEESVLRCPLGKLMLKYGKLKSRATKLNGFVRDLREDESLETGGNTVSAVTGRTTHYTVVNVPKVGKLYGKEMRSIFTHREGYILLGADLSALESRLIGHYTWQIDNGVFAKRIIEECPHDKTVELFNELNIDRDTAKTCNHALGFGCGIKKLATILDCNKSTAARMKSIWWKDKQPLVDLQAQLEMCSQGRNPLWIKGLDGRKVFGRDKKDLVNTLIQSAGAVVNKFITVEIHNEINSREIKDIYQISNFHDEVNFELRKKDVDILKEIIYNSIEKCNNYFNFYVPMDMEIKVGENWACIH